MKQDLEYVRERLGAPGAVNRVAELVLRVAKEKNEFIFSFVKLCTSIFNKNYHCYYLYNDGSWM